MSLAPALAVASALKWPATLTVALLMFGLSTEGTLSLLSNNAHKLTTPVSAQPASFNVAPTRQIGTLSPFIVTETSRQASDLETDVPLNEQLPDMAGGTPVQAPSVVESVAPATSALSDLSTARIGPSAVNVRAEPSKSSAKVGVLAAGAEVRLGAARNGWQQVSYAGGEGWIYKDYLATGGGASTKASGALAEVGIAEIGSRMTVRQSPSTTSPSMFTLQPGERVRIADRQGSWLKVVMVSGDTGWIRAR